MPGSTEGDASAPVVVTTNSGFDHKLDHVLKIVTDLVTKFSNLSTRVINIEACPAVSTPFPTIPPEIPYDLPGYGGMLAATMQQALLVSTKILVPSLNLVCISYITIVSNAKKRQAFNIMMMYS